MFHHIILVQNNYKISENALSIQAADLVQVCGELLRKLWFHDFDPVPEAAKPGEELIGQLHFRHDGEMLFIDLAVMRCLCSEALNHGVQQRIDEAKSDVLALAADHAEDALGVVLEIQRLECLFSVSWLPCRRDGFHAVHAIGPHFL